MAGIKDLKLGKDIVINDQDWEAMPEQLGSRKPPLQPGPYRFQFARAGAISECFDTVEATVEGKQATRIVAILRDEAALTVVQTPSKYADRVGEAFSTRISNVERRRGKAEDAPMASDMDYVLKSLAPNEPRPRTNRQYAELFQRAVPERELGADVEWNWRCDERKPVRVPDPANEGRTMPLDGEDDREKRNGCGTRYYQRDVSREDKNGNPDPQGEYPRTVNCQCGAVLFANENLTNFKA